ncbi:MAG: hypothetical protein ACYTKD_29735 [Planctomycetota bacterium]|jgi:hypothetical protein
MPKTARLLGIALAMVGACPGCRTRLSQDQGGKSNGVEVVKGADDFFLLKHLPGTDGAIGVWAKRKANAYSIYRIAVTRLLPMTARRKDGSPAADSSTVLHVVDSQLRTIDFFKEGLLVCQVEMSGNAPQVIWIDKGGTLAIELRLGEDGTETMRVHTGPGTWDERKLPDDMAGTLLLAAEIEQMQVLVLRAERALNQWNRGTEDVEHKSP